ncbi:MAG: HAMP domain-containing histidine kinase [Colwellia sp.]|nr:HAMP domain-containing histidine kinase [Colwellia sp.]
MSCSSFDDVHYDQQAAEQVKKLTNADFEVDNKTESYTEQVNLGDIVSRVQSELTYLLTGKAIIVKLDLEQSLVNIAVTPSIIVLNNLIPNAFQHTQQGVVTIKQRNNNVTITNMEALALTDTNA